MGTVGTGSDLLDNSCSHLVPTSERGGNGRGWPATADARGLLDDLTRQGIAVVAAEDACGRVRLRVPQDAVPAHYLALLQAWEPAVVAAL